MHDRFHTLVEVITRAVKIEFRRGANRQAFDRGREVALVRDAGQIFFKSERADDFRAAGDERDDARGMGTLFLKKRLSEKKNRSTMPCRGESK